MNLEDSLKEAAAAAVGPLTESDVEDRLYALNEKWDESLGENCADLVMLTKLGVAAYLLGVHYLIQDRLDAAEHWLRIAADHDVGDAALRLGYLYELRAVASQNGESCDDEAVALAKAHQDESLRWFARARAAGYRIDRSDRGRLEMPFESLECCPDVTQEAAQERARKLDEAATVRAMEILRDASADARKLRREARIEAVEATRQEIAGLLQERDELTEQVVELNTTLRELAARLPTRHPGHPYKREPMIDIGRRFRDRVRRMLGRAVAADLYWPAGTTAQQRVGSPAAVLDLVSRFPTSYAVVTAPLGTSYLDPMPCSCGNGGRVDPALATPEVGRYPDGTKGEQSAISDPDIPVDDPTIFGVKV